MCERGLIPSLYVSPVSTRLGEFSLFSCFFSYHRETKVVKLETDVKPRPSQRRAINLELAGYGLASHGLRVWGVWLEEERVGREIRGMVRGCGGGDLRRTVRRHGSDAGRGWWWLMVRPMAWQWSSSLSSLANSGGALLPLWRIVLSNFTYGPGDHTVPTPPTTYRANNVRSTYILPHVGSLVASSLSCLLFHKRTPFHIL
jgi:hypothetical protein